MILSKNEKYCNENTKGYDPVATKTTATDAALCIKESQNNYYSSSAPRQYYDKNTLVYMKLEQIEKNDK